MYFIAGREARTTLHPGTVHPDQAARRTAARGGGSPFRLPAAQAPSPRETRRGRLRNGKQN
jgi:hypothetical protein